ncbi:hypothetical protein Q8F55_004616 [Vanrija albida]|uniref:Major facilitator superfamily (MFS) profile domain-containing protein n=1 Tax=Vanrija albida TaxID=181172 RepID=A0ABR3Q795_9TREE
MADSKGDAAPAEKALVDTAAAAAAAALTRTESLGPPPDGGRDAWLCVLGTTMTGFTQFGMCTLSLVPAGSDADAEAAANSFGVFQAYYVSGPLAAYSPSAISWIGSMQMFLMFFGGIFIGRLFDRHGPHVLMVPGALCLVLSLILTSVCTQYYQFLLAQGVLFGLGSTLLFHPSVAAPGQWFARRRALAMGVASLGSGLGGVVWPIVVRRLIVQIVPWSTTFTPLAEAPFALLTAGTCLVIMYMPFTFLATNAARVGASPDLSFYTLALLNAGSIAGRVVSMLGDKYGRFNTMAVSGVLTGAVLLAFWIPLSSVPQVLAFAVVFGFVSGILISICFACVQQVATPKDVGRKTGLMWAIASFFSLSGPPINGELIARYGGARGYRYAGAFSGAVVLLSVVLVLASKLKQDKRLFAVV